MQLETSPNTIQVLALPHVLDPTMGRVELTVLPGQTLAEMAAEALPLARQIGADYLRIYINGHVVEAENWHRVRAKAGMHVLIRAIPQGDTFKNVLTIIVSIAAISAGQFYAPELLGLLSVGVNSATSAAATFAISSPVLRGGRLLHICFNRQLPGRVVPVAPSAAVRRVTAEAPSYPARKGPLGNLA